MPNSLNCSHLLDSFANETPSVMLRDARRSDAVAASNLLLSTAAFIFNSYAKRSRMYPVLFCGAPVTIRACLISVSIL
jgi:hypothetical protein